MAKRTSTGRLASMSDVARSAGVSTMTVSNVINRPEIVAEKTREKVEAAMLRLNYRNNLVARSLRLAQPRQIGYCLTVGQDPANQYMGEFLHDLARACQTEGRNLTLIAEPPGEEELDACEHLYYGQSVAGFIISDIEPDDPRPELFEHRGIPFVAYGQTSAGPDVPWSWVDADAAAGIALAVDHCVALGHRELAFVGVVPQQVAATARLAGYREACARHGLDSSLANERLVAASNGIPAGIGAAQTLLDSDVPPTAIICISDSLAAGVILALRERSLVVGRDVAVTGFDDTPITAFGSIGITSVRQPVMEIVQSLVGMIVSPPDEATHALLPPELIVRSSTIG